MSREMNENDAFSSSCGFETERTLLALPPWSKVMVEFKMSTPQLAVWERMCTEVASEMETCVRSKVVKQMFSAQGLA